MTSLPRGARGVVALLERVVVFVPAGFLGLGAAFGLITGFVSVSVIYRRFLNECIGCTVATGQSRNEVNESHRLSISDYGSRQHLMSSGAGLH